MLDVLRLQCAQKLLLWPRFLNLSTTRDNGTMNAYEDLRQLELDA